jgi:phosphatidylglycerol:prolipoprotein diacylglycerol transferase
MSFHGGALGVIIAVVVFARLNKIDVLKLGDLVAPCVPFGLFFGRIANFINGELWGRPTDAPWGVVFCNDSLRAASRDGVCAAGEVARHPSQLYEAALEGVVLFLILRWATHRAGCLARPGLISGMFLLFYGLFRIGVEFLREPDGHLPEALRGYATLGMLLSIPMVLAGLWLMARARRNPATVDAAVPA